MSNLIIDVSYHNGVINWERVKASGCAGAILRCGYGDDIASQDDKQWIRNLAECERLGIPVGVYLYSYATCDRQAKSELEHILRLIKGHTFQLPIFIDVVRYINDRFTHTIHLSSVRSLLRAPLRISA